MKTTYTFLILSFIFSTIPNAFAQYGGSGGYGSNYNGGGYGSNPIGKGVFNDNTKPKHEEVPAEEIATEAVKRMKEPLKLDELQTIAITNIIAESYKAQGVLMKQEFTQEEQIKNFTALAETTDQKINQLLYKEQKELYIAYKEDQKIPKQKDEKKKDKKDKKKKEKK